jgi:hypothetical protein
MGGDAPGLEPDRAAEVVLRLVPGLRLDSHDAPPNGIPAVKGFILRRFIFHKNCCKNKDLCLRAERKSACADLAGV